MRGRGIRWLIALAVIAPVGVGVAVAATSTSHAKAATVKAASSSKYGMVLVGSTGKALYRYTPDRKGVSNCKGACVAYWPAYMLSGTAKPTVGGGAKASLVGTIKRGKGRQVTYAGFPLYSYVGDKKAGAVSGEGFEKTWYLVNTKGALVKHAVATTTTTTTPTTTSGGTAWG